MLLLPGCVQTTAEYDAEVQAQLNAQYAGRPLSVFIDRTTLLPSDAFDSEGQRVFIFNVPCASWWYTTYNGSGATGPENFIVNSVRVTGYCA
jgi:hypothetical protein